MARRIFDNVFGLQWQCNGYLSIHYVPKKETGVGMMWESIEIREIRITQPITTKMMEDGIIEFKIPNNTRVIVTDNKAVVYPKGE